MANSLADRAKEIDVEREELRAGMALLANGWVGDGAEAAQERFRLVDARLSNNARALNTSAELAGAIRDTYEQADVRIARLFGDA